MARTKKLYRVGISYGDYLAYFMGREVSLRGARIIANGQKSRLKEWAQRRDDRKPCGPEPTVTIWKAIISIKPRGRKHGA